MRKAFIGSGWRDLILESGCFMLFRTIAIFVLLSTPAAAQSLGVIRGTGNDSCGSYLAAASGNAIAKSRTLEVRGDTFFDKSYAYSEWIQGYLSGLSVVIDTTKANRTDYPGIDAWMRKWCAAHPAENIFKAISEFVNETRGQ